MKHTIRWILTLVTACVITSAVTYSIAHHRGYERGYWNGLHSGIREGCYSKSLELYVALQQLRAGDLPGAIQDMETACFAEARTYYRNPVPGPGEPNQSPDISAARALAKGLSEYRAAYRTNSAEWDDAERMLDGQLAKIKSDDETAWAGIVIAPVVKAPANDTFDSRWEQYTNTHHW